MAIQRKVGQTWRLSRPVNYWNTTAQPGVYQIVGFQRRRAAWQDTGDDWRNDNNYIRLRPVDAPTQRDLVLERQQFQLKNGWHLLGEGALEEKNYVVTCRRCFRRDVILGPYPPTSYDCPDCLKRRGRRIPKDLRTKLNVGPVVVG